ncbi:MAG TPA: nucleotide sugar dehydrogenase [Anaerolineae bacterium]|nr:nucleotide sugar dehydrogenase [Anaerolineae bacterium]HIQ04448.1 nucleotide sugar dehydrogenase [Anaerolineae bacterium]
MKSALQSKINDRTAQIAVIGLGYVGLPLAMAFAEAGFPVTGVDVDERKVTAIQRGESYIQDVPSSRLATLVAAATMPERRGRRSADNGQLSATTDYVALDSADVAIICVPTPLNKTRDPDVRFLISAGESIAEHLHPGMLVVLESTTYPGTTDELLRPMLEKTGLRAGQDFFLAFSPERIDPGNKTYGIRNTPKVVGGMTSVCLETAVALYETIVEQVVSVSSTATAEMVKLLENTFRAVNIALVNEVALMCDKLGLNVWEVIDAAATKPYGFMKFTPGPGLGGHCIPVDPHYLAWKLKTVNYNARFIELASEVNTSMPRYVVEKVTDALNDDFKPVRGSHILVLGVAYKRDIDDVRESPALDIIRLLQEKGAEVVYHDPYVPELSLDGRLMRSNGIDEAELEAADCVVVATDHSVYDWSWVLAHTQLVVDTRNASKGVTGKARVVRM